MKSFTAHSHSHALHRFCVPPDCWMGSRNQIGLDLAAAALCKRFGPQAIITSLPYRSDAYVLTDTLDEFDYAETLAERIRKGHWPNLPVVAIGWRNSTPTEWPKATIYESAWRLWNTVSRQNFRHHHIETIHGKNIQEITETLELAVRCRRICVFEDLVPASFLESARAKIVDAIARYLGHAKFEFVTSSQDSDVFLLLDSAATWSGAEKLFDVQDETQPDLPIILLRPGPGGLKVEAYPNLEITLDVYADHHQTDQSANADDSQA